MTSESAFFHAFLEEGLRFSSSLYLCLIWIRVLRHVFENPNEAAEYLKSHTFFKEFVSRPSTDAYVDGLCNSLQSICIGSPVIRSTENRRLSEMLMDESSSDNEIPGKKSRVTFQSESEDDALPGTSAMSVAEVVRRASSSKKKYTARARLYSETEDNAIPTVPAMTSEEDGDVTSPSKKQKKQKKAKKY